MKRIPLVGSISYPWIVVGLVMIGQMGQTLYTGGLPTLYPFIKLDFGLSNAEVGLITAGIILGATTTNILTGWLTDTLGVRWVMTVSPVCVGMLVVLFSQSQSLIHIILLAFLMSAAGAALYPAAIKAVMEWMKPERRSLAMGVEQTNIPMTGILTASLLPFLAATYSWRTAAVVLAILIASAGLVILAFYRDNPESSYTRRREGSPRKSLAAVAGNRDIWVASLCVLSIGSVQQVFVSFLILYLKEHLSISTVEAARYMAVAHASAAVWLIAWGTASDVLLRGRKVATLALMGLLSTGSMALMATIPADGSPFLVGTIVFFVGAGFFGWGSMHPVLLAELAGPGLTGTVMGFSQAVRGVLGFGLIPLFGFVVDKTGSYDAGWWMMAFLAASGILVLALLRPEARSL